MGGGEGRGDDWARQLIARSRAPARPRGVGSEREEGVAGGSDTGVLNGGEAVWVLTPCGSFGNERVPVAWSLCLNSQYQC